MLRDRGLRRERVAKSARAERGLGRAVAEGLESRRLLTVTAGEYVSICASYPEFALPADMAQINVIDISSDELNAANLKNAIATAGSSSLPDLVVLRTTDMQNTITYASSADGVVIDIPSTKGAISIVGFGSGPLTLDAAGKCGVVWVGSPSSTTTVNLGGMALKNGFTTYFGAGVCQTAGTLRLTNVAIRSNTAATGSVLSPSNAKAGDSSTGGSGGGLYQSSGTLVLTNVTIRANAAAYYGGGMYQSNGTSTLTNVIISGNTADSGGALYQLGGTSTLTNSTISGNAAASYGGVYLRGITSTLGNSIVAGNSGPDLCSSSSTLSGSYNLIGDGSSQTSLVNGTSGNLVGTTKSPIDAKLAEDPRDGIGLSPLPGSPAIDAGNNSLIPSGIATDVYGAARIQGLRVNIGAVETGVPMVLTVTYVVTSLADSMAADGVVTLREALAAANSNQVVGDAPAGSYSSRDRIEFSPGLSGTIQTHGKAYVIAGGVDVTGPGADQLTLDAGGNGDVIDIRGVYAASISGLRLTGGNSSQGGGITGVGAALALDHLVISGNTGSGVYLSGGTVALTNSTLSANTSSLYGGGLYQKNVTTTLTNVTISGNTAMAYGGGVYEDGGTMAATNVTISGNTSGIGGGVYQMYGTSMLINVAISGNMAYLAGGGVYGYQLARLTIANAVLVGNTAGSGGGVYGAAFSTWMLTNVTICGNAAVKRDGSGNDAGWGGGMYLMDDNYGETYTIRNAIIAQNTAEYCQDIWQNRGMSMQPTNLAGSNNLIGNTAGESALVSGVNGNLVGTSANPIGPRFVSMAGTDWTKWDLRLQANSPAVNAGSNALVPTGVTTDIAGAMRIQGGRVDMGAYETDPTPVAVTGFEVNDGSAQRSMVNKVVVTFSEAVTLANGALGVAKSNGAIIPNVTVTAGNPSGDQKTWELTFSGSGAVGGSLPDGMYKLVVSAAGVSDLAGNHMVGDYSQKFHRLFGDVDGDRDVDAKDLVAFKQVLNRPGSYVWWLDLAGDKKTDNADYLQLRLRLLRPVLR